MQCPFHEWDCAFRPCEQHVFSPCVSSTPTPEQREWDTMLLYFAVAQRETRKVLQATHTHTHTHTPLTHSHTHTLTHPSLGTEPLQGTATRWAAGGGSWGRKAAPRLCTTVQPLPYCALITISSSSSSPSSSQSSSVWLPPLSHPSHTASASTSGRMVSWCSALKSFVDRSIAPSVSCPLMFGMSAGFCQQKKKQVTVRAHLSAAAAATTAPYSLQGWAD